MHDPDNKLQHPLKWPVKVGVVSIALSGGSSPIVLYKGLSSINLDWTRVRVTLIDDRLVPADHDDSNQKLVRKTLLQGRPQRLNSSGFKTGRKVIFPISRYLGWGRMGILPPCFLS